MEANTPTECFHCICSPMLLISDNSMLPIGQVVICDKLIISEPRLSDNPLQAQFNTEEPPLC